MKVVPVITGANGSLTTFQKYLEHTPGKHSSAQLQKTAVLGTAHTLRKVLT
jgi:hypothetical protein